MYWEELQKLATLYHYWILRVFDQRGWNLRVVMQEFIDSREISQDTEFNIHPAKTLGDEANSLLGRLLETWRKWLLRLSQVQMLKS